MKPIALLPILALCTAAPAAPAPEALRAAAVLAAARAAGVAHPGDCRAWLAWATYPGRFPDGAAVAAHLDPARPAPSGAGAPPRLRLTGGDEGLTRLARALTGIEDIEVRTLPRGATSYDHDRHVVFLAPDADLPALLHELGHAVCGVSDAALYEREFRDVPGVFQGASTPADTALWRSERDADAAFSAGILSAGRASRSYWRGIAAALARRNAP